MINFNTSHKVFFIEFLKNIYICIITNFYLHNIHINNFSTKFQIINFILSLQLLFFIYFPLTDLFSYQ